MNRVAPLLILLALGACTTAKTSEQHIRTVETLVPKAVSCVPDILGKAPDYPDTDAALKAAPDVAARYALVAAGRGLRDARLAAVEPVIATCREAAK